jgi:formylglycine-generating enzyme required for sulfatase activity
MSDSLVSNHNYAGLVGRQLSTHRSVNYTLVRLFLLFALTSTLLSNVSTTVFAEQPNKLALVIGVGSYRANTGLASLEYSVSDAEAIGRCLQSAGFTVTLLLQNNGEGRSSPTLENIRGQLATACDSTHTNKIEEIVVTIHGRWAIQNGQGSADSKTPKLNFCPVNASLQDTTNSTSSSVSSELIALEEIYSDLSKCNCPRKLLIVDLYHTQSTDTKMVDNLGSTNMSLKFPPPPHGVTVFCSCGLGHTSIDNQDLGRGVFAYYLIEGLRGGACSMNRGNGQDGTMTLAEITSYVAFCTDDFVVKNYDGIKQLPEIHGDCSLDYPFAKVNLGIIGSNAGEVRPFTGMAIPFCWCPSGSFTIGSPENEAEREQDEGPADTTLTHGFWIGQTEVTQSQWKSVMKVNSSEFSPNGRHKERVAGLPSSQFPVENISWYDAIEYCNRLSESEALPACYVFNKVQRVKGRIVSAHVELARNVKDTKCQMGYRLPSEAEWEYACRAGTKTPFHFGDISDGSRANIYGEEPYGTTRTGAYLERPTVVGSYNPNTWCLYDMHGNIGEWCFDSYDARLLGGLDPLRSKNATRRVTRGGAWDYVGQATRSASRNEFSPSMRLDTLGFRLAKTR